MPPERDEELFIPPGEESPPDIIEYEKDFLKRLQATGLDPEQAGLLRKVLLHNGLELEILSDAEIADILAGRTEDIPAVPGVGERERPIFLKLLATRGLGLRIATETERELAAYQQILLRQRNLEPTSADLQDLMNTVLGRKKVPLRKPELRITDIPGAPFTIDIPGLLDIIKIPLDRKSQEQLAESRIKRMLTYKSPVPEDLRWIPHVINILDDVQDMIYTFFPLAKVLLLGVAPRLIPAIGIVMLAGDALNLATGILSIPMMGPGIKKLAYLQGRYFKGRTRRVGGIRRSGMRRVRIGAWMAQAGQSLRTLTGFGIQLGPLMGTMSDAFWAMMRIQQGEHVIVRGPPSHTRIDAVARYLYLRPSLTYVQDCLSVEDFIRVLVADLMATHIMTTEGDPKKMENRAEEALEIPVPASVPWMDITREKLKLYGIDADTPATMEMIITQKIVRLKDQLAMSHAYHKRWLEDLQNTLKDERLLSIFHQIYNRIDAMIWDLITGTKDSLLILPETALKVAGVSIEHGVIPIKERWVPPQRMINLFVRDLSVALPLGVRSHADTEKLMHLIAKRDSRIKLNIETYLQVLRNSGYPVPDRIPRRLAELTEHYHGKLTVVEPATPTTEELKRFINRAEDRMAATGRKVPSREQLKEAVLDLGLFWHSGKVPSPPKK